jgi:hypothetical protein
MADQFGLRFRLPRKSLGSLTCRKFATWDRRLYFPSEGRHAVEFFRSKNPTASARFEPAILGTRGQHANRKTTEVAFQQFTVTIPLFLTLCRFISFSFCLVALLFLHFINICFIPGRCTASACAGCVSESDDFATLFFFWFGNTGAITAIAILLPTLKRMLLYIHCVRMC